MTVRFGLRPCAVLVATCLLCGCVGKLLGGGKPDDLYRFGGSARAADISQPEPVRDNILRQANMQQAIVLEPVKFAAEIDGNRMLAVSGTSARYIKGSRWLTSGPDLFTEALRRSFQARATGLRLTAQQGSDLAGYSVAIRIGRFEAQYDAPLMANPPTIVMEGDATLYAMSDRKVVAQHHFSARVPALQNRVAALVAGFDQAAACAADGITDWVRRAAAHQPQEQEPACAPTP